MAEGLQLIVIILFSEGTLVLLPALLPGRVARAQQIAQNSPGRAFVIGLVTSSFLAWWPRSLPRGMTQGACLR
jgi:hypothetical protein